MTQHILKSWPEFFEAIRDGSRTHELRRNDRMFGLGDELLLREYDPHDGSYSGEELRLIVTSLTSAGVPCAVSDEGLNANFCILSVKAASS